MADKIKAKIITARVRTEIEGELDDGLWSAFLLIGSAERRQALIDRMQDTHNELVEAAANAGKGI